ncbi:hypothetical protein WOLCODRAFT_22358 [Wolfiporia cocos MD-104 SS10]|uniref:Uncharacterized protein n=1 Tax=Wolfiporia cocos (strain MD-104) TaxID=742152 RepID=A0A2H3J2F6_WOLCO|nr:hypothetical protein WOLCODRAFT_22358 [Wolfiporia cocos MD-104 SS10]
MEATVPCTDIENDRLSVSSESRDGTACDRIRRKNNGSSRRVHIHEVPRGILEEHRDLPVLIDIG